MKPKVQADRRRYARYETDLRIQYFVTFDIKTQIRFKVKNKSKRGFPSTKYSAISRNISAEGLSFQSKKKLQRGDILSLEVYVPSAQQPISMIGEVRWSCLKKDTKTRVYDTGILLTQVEGQNVETSIIIDPVHHLAWSIVLETVFGEFKHIVLQKSTKK